MVNYECQRCGYQTTNKSYLKRHLLRKNLCKPIMNEIDRYDLLISNGFDEESKIYEKSAKNTHLYPQKSSINEDNICRYCNKKLSSYKNKWRHEKTCKQKKEIDELSLLKEQNKILVNKDKEREKEIKEYKKQQDKEMKKMMKLIEKLMMKSTNNTTNNNTNKGTINNNQQNIVFNFGKEEIEYIKPKDFVKLIEKPLNAIPRLLELKHFHPKHPENHTVRKLNKHDKFMEIMKNNKWEIKDKNDVIFHLIDYLRSDIEMFKEENDHVFNNSLNKNYDIILESCEDENNKQLNNKILITVINKSKDNIVV